VWPAILITSLLLILGFVRTGIRIFWNSPPMAEAQVQRVVPLAPVVVIAGMIAAIAALSLLAGFVMDDLTITADQLLSPQRYIAAVLRPRVATGLAGE
jgi:multicomponent K+:H+ antiporter subunit D